MLFTFHHGLKNTWHHQLKKEEALIFAHSLKGRALASGPNDKCAITEAHGVSTCREGMRNWERDIEEERETLAATRENE